jgi:hypothetical protein
MGASYIIIIAAGPDRLRLYYYSQCRPHSHHMLYEREHSEVPFAMHRIARAIAP